MDLDSHAHWFVRVLMGKPVTDHASKVVPVFYSINDVAVMVSQLIEDSCESADFAENLCCCLADFSFECFIHQCLGAEKILQRYEVGRSREFCQTLLQLVSCHPLQQLQFGEVLRIDNADWDFVIINHDEIVDPMALEQVENFHRELVLMNRHRI